jgi:hypothetical protein
MAIGNNIMSIGNNNQSQNHSSKISKSQVPVFPVLIVGCLLGVFPCSRVPSFVSLPEEQDAGWLSGLCAFLSLSRAAAASLSPRTPAANKRYGLSLFSFFFLFLSLCAL